MLESTKGYQIPTSRIVHAHSAGNLKRHCNTRPNCLNGHQVCSSSLINEPRKEEEMGFSLKNMNIPKEAWQRQSYIKTRLHQGQPRTSSDISQALPIGERRSARYPTSSKNSESHAAGREVCQSDKTKSQISKSTVHKLGARVNERLSNPNFTYCACSLRWEP